MTVVHFGFPAPGTLGPAHATIGTFDGVHRGHQALLRPLIAGAGRDGVSSVLVTFEPHPRCVLDPDHCPPNLTTLEEKIWLLDQLGVQQVIVIPFTAQVAALTPAAFMQRLTRGMQLRHLITGEELHRHSVRMMKVALGRVVDDVLQADINRRAAELYWKGLIGFVAQTIEKQRVNSCRLFSDESGERSALSAVPFARCAQAAKEIDLELGRFRKFIFW